MAATIPSPTPLAASYNEHHLHRRTASRQPTTSSSSSSLRPILRNGPSALASSVNNPPLQHHHQPTRQTTAANPQPWNFSMADLSSSDDEMPVPQMKFSAEVKSLLGDEASVLEHASSGVQHKRIATATMKRATPLSERFRERMDGNGSGSPAVTSRQGSPRVVRLSASVNSTVNAVHQGAARVQRSASVQHHHHHHHHEQHLQQQQHSPEVNKVADLVTPAPRPRSQLSASSRSPRTGSGHVSALSSEEPRSAYHSSSAGGRSSPAGNASHEEPRLQDAETKMGSLSISRSRTDEAGTHTAQRQRRVQVTGKFLKGPARRGMKRRQSDEDHSPQLDNAPSSAEALPAQAVTDHEDEVVSEKKAVAFSHISPPHASEAHSAQSIKKDRDVIMSGSPAPRKTDSPQVSLIETVEAKPAHQIVKLQSPAMKDDQPFYKLPPMPPILPSRYDQENEPPPTFKRNKPSGVGLGEKDKFNHLGKDDNNNKMLTPATASPSRPALVARHQNTPHRPAPPPPKMSLLETVTAAPGAASASHKKRRNFLSVNGKMFTRMDVIGKGGSSKVYRVMAENYKIFALKRVLLEDQDESAIQGFKGEIDLLRRLENVDRVVRLYDYEINEEKQTLSVLMEMGESDLNRVLNQRFQNPSSSSSSSSAADEPALDLTTTRYFWKEMLECVAAVHALNIVHSDLKPANFLLTQGRLKLIDFGISNAIADNTVNVHREQTIGTPNYMSPEALIDLNAGGSGKLLKLGKPSDVWSLGCILYQMVYGRAPFAQIPTTAARVMAIANPKHSITFHERGTGGTTIPAGLLHTLKACLNRDQHVRPTVAQLLRQNDPFLNPDNAATDGHGMADSTESGETVRMDKAMLARMQRDIVRHVVAHGAPSEKDVLGWAEAVFDNVRALAKT